MKSSNSGSGSKGWWAFWASWTAYALLRRGARRPSRRPRHTLPLPPATRHVLHAAEASDAQQDAVRHAGEPVDRAGAARQRGILHGLDVDAGAVARGYEGEGRATVRNAVVFTGATLVLVAAVVGALAWFFGALRADERARVEAAAGPFGDTRERPPAPRLQAHPALDLRALQARDAARLTTYGRQPDGFYRIPLSRALELVAAEGLPVRADTAGADTLRLVPTESGWTRRRPGPLPPTSPAYPGGFPTGAARPQPRRR